MLAALTERRLVTVSEGTRRGSPTKPSCANGPASANGSRRTAEGSTLRRHITEAANEWDDAGRDEGRPLPRARLTAALDWTADHDPSSTSSSANSWPRAVTPPSTRPDVSAAEPTPPRPPHRGGHPARRRHRRRHLRRRPARTSTRRSRQGGGVRRAGAQLGNGPACPAPGRPGPRRGRPRPLAPCLRAKGSRSTTR